MSRLCESPAYAVPLDTPTGEMNSLKGVGKRPNKEIDRINRTAGK